MNNIAVIIARSGSKGLANKSMRPLGGKPLVAWTIEHALGSQRVDAVVLSSDGHDILEVGRSYGIEVFERPEALATDSATIDSGARHGVECWEHKHRIKCRYVAILYGNVALRPPDLTERALQKLIESEADSVQTIYHVGKMHPLWMKKLNGPNGDVLEHYELNEIYRRQDLPPVYMLNSGVLAVTRNNLFNVDPQHPHAFLGHDRRAIETARDEIVDVDDDLDLALAEILLAQQHLVKVDR